MKFIYYHPESREDRTTVVRLAELLGWTSNQDLFFDSKIKLFPYLIFYTDLCSLSYCDLDKYECDKYGLNVKDFKGIINFLISKSEK